MSRSITTVRRKKKNADPLRSAWHILEDWLEVNRRQIVTIGGIAIGTVLVVALLWYFLDYRKQSQLQAFNDAYSKFTATVGPAPAASANGGPTPVTFPDAQTKFTESAAAFERFGFEPRKHPTQRVMRGDAVGQRNILAQPVQLRLAERGLERKLDTDSGDNVIVGQNHFKKLNEEIKVGEVFKLDPTVAQRALEKFQRVLDTRQQAAVDDSLSKLAVAATKDRENVMPYLVECCHAYATVGEMVACLKKEWGEFKEPVNL